MTQLVPLTTPDEVETFLAQFPLAAIFKAGTCHKTMQGFGVLETYLARHELPVGFIRVVDWRPASNHVAERTGVRHHSPQFLLFKNGQSVFDVDNWDITPQALAPVFEAHVPLRTDTAEGISTNIEPYKQLMHQFLNDELNEWQFQEAYVNYFRDDANLRSQREFELLSRLFGDPDAYHGGLHQLGAPQSRGDLKTRVQELLAQL
ncbi:thioredoxin family protein [Deinococcus peraridilitoris]|uniref:Colicin D immunity protein domain-containing protein n=1 Tax=Deinococcus peraridilitoris (strain DSM 19664 / LMG 22246 / CIP 109416 / KR-200) TaxID=937777 RepID=L0A452_DEIPD|nr:thioredoxin family protein [Deinococcus peraridilitoris]AFZ68611.1 Protein of unknown function (DUF2847) [Deinococcus peraridilitoris DSM 19664]